MMIYSREHPITQRSSPDQFYVMKKLQVNPFYFMSYDRVIGVAHDTNELAREMKRLSKENPAAVEYHLENGHIVQWLDYAGERELARELVGVTNVEEAQRKIEKQAQRSMTLQRMSHGRMR
jgi:dTDP-4-dehydrorhamnose reductase